MKLLRRGSNADEDEPSIDSGHTSSDLDLQVRTTKPQAWAAVLVALVAIVGVIIWSVVATIPQYETIKGILTTQDPQRQISAEQAGDLSEAVVAVGQTVRAGQPILKFQPLGSNREVIYRMPKDGMILELPTLPGAKVRVGDPLVVYSPTDRTRPLYALFYGTPQQVSAVGVGQEVVVTVIPGGYEAVGVVVSVAEVPSLIPQMIETLGSPERAKEAFDQTGGVPMAVTVDLGADPAWIGEPPLSRPPSRTQAELTLEIANPHPIDLVLGQ